MTWRNYGTTKPQKCFRKCAYGACAGDATLNEILLRSWSKKVKHQKLNWHSFGLGLGMFQKIILNTYAYPIYCIDEYPMYIWHKRIIISEPIHKIFMVFIVFTWLNYTDSVCSYLKHRGPSSQHHSPLLGFTAIIMVFSIKISWFYHYVPNISISKGSKNN